MNKKEQEKCIYKASKQLQKVKKRVIEHNSNLPKELILNINVDYIPTSFEIADTYNINCVYKKMDGDKPSYYDDFRRTIYISDRFGINSYEAKFLCAHELGHYFMQDDVEMVAMNIDELNRFLPEEIMKEYEANVFAILLMPQFMAGQPWEDYLPLRLNRKIYDKIYERYG